MGWSTAGHYYMVKDFFKHRKSTSFPDQFPVLGRIISQILGIWFFNKEQMPRKVFFLSTEGRRQIPLNEQFLRKCPSADLKPEEILISVNIPYSKKVRLSFQFLHFTCEPTAC